MYLSDIYLSIVSSLKSSNISVIDSEFSSLFWCQKGLWQIYLFLNVVSVSLFWLVLIKNASTYANLDSPTGPLCILELVRPTDLKLTKQIACHKWNVLKWKFWCQHFFDDIIIYIQDCTVPWFWWHHKFQPEAKCSDAEALAGVKYTIQYAMAFHWK